jgi:broad specificity phosphatase PhoE
MTGIILVRHGQTEWNRIERFRGRADVPLNHTGLAQAEMTGRRIAAEWLPAAIYAGPLSRTLQTAEAIGACSNLPVRVEERLVDIDYGEWQGLTPDEVRGRWPEVLSAWYDTPHLAHIPGGETLDHLRARAMSAVNDLAARHLDQTIVLVSHTVVNRIILLGVLGLRNERFWRLRQDTCAINVFEMEEDLFTLVTMNDTAHLQSLKGI